MNDYIKTGNYYTVYAYSVTGERIKMGTYVSLIKAKQEARKYQNWQIEVTYYMTNLPF